ncbi:winged helix-turn-helix transcriptional regulator [candidate division KSB1 bacterium]|nr:winged helix-turn-helix transcriptional regulator [candidate division KSB1 bacterium]TDI98482.1 MAG: ArsR family transcriptional regulator [Caldithrix sp.]
MASQLIPEELLERVAQRFKTLSEPIRLQLLNQMMVTSDEMSVMQLVEETGQQQANVSKHLTLMAREGILVRRKEGQKVYYRINDPSIHGICTLVCGRLQQEVDSNLELVEKS